MHHHICKTLLLDEVYRFDRFPLMIDGTQGEWGAGDSIAAEEELPSPPTNVAARSGNGRVTITWDPVPDAMYYNLYFQTTKGVMIKSSDLTRPIASADDFKAVIGVKKDKATCLEGTQSPFVHDDLANGTCYHYVVTVVTQKGESFESEEVMAIPSPYLLAMSIGCEGVDDGEFSSPTGINSTRMAISTLPTPITIRFKNLTGRESFSRAGAAIPLRKKGTSTIRGAWSSGRMTCCILQTAAITAFKSSIWKAM